MLTVTFHHLGIYVENLDSIAQFYVKVFEMQIVSQKFAEYLPEYKEARIIFLKSQCLIIELIGPINSGAHNKTHIALAVPDIVKFIEHLDRAQVLFRTVYREDGSINFIKFCDPEFNEFEIFEKK